MTDEYFILDGHKPVEVASALEWGEWFGKADRQVALTRLPDGVVSTVFLGLNHNFGFGRPILFETMVFRDDRDETRCERCATWEEAEAQHERIAKEELDGGLR